MHDLWRDLSPWDLKARVEGLPLETLNLGRRMHRIWCAWFWGAVALVVASIIIEATRSAVTPVVYLIVGLGLNVEPHLRRRARDAARDQQWGASECLRWLSIRRAEAVGTAGAASTAWVLSNLVTLIGTGHLNSPVGNLSFLALMTGHFMLRSTPAGWSALLALTRGYRKAPERRRAPLPGLGLRRGA